MNSQEDERFRKRAFALFSEWKENRTSFAEKYPHIQISIEIGKSPDFGVFKSIVEYLDGRFSWKVGETIDGNFLLLRERD